MAFGDLLRPMAEHARPEVAMGLSAADRVLVSHCDRARERLSACRRDSRPSYGLLPGRRGKSHSSLRSIATGILVTFDLPA